VQALELILILLALAAAMDLVARRISVPLPSLLVVGGLVIALIPGLPRVDLDPDTVFLFFVPPLLYWAALNTSFRDFKENIRSITLLGVGLVLVTMSATAVVAHYLIPGMPWGSAFVLGAIVSPPDAVAVTAVTRRLGIPKIIVTILEGESLVNDATALVAYRMAVVAVVAGTFSIWEAGIRFGWTAAGGIALGFAIAWLIVLVRQPLENIPEVENIVSLLTPYAVFIPAERLGLASALAVVSAGLYLGRQGPKFVSAPTRLQAQSIWKVLVFILEGLIFIIIGLELPVVRAAIQGQSIAALINYALVITMALILVRMVWVFPGTYLPRFIRRKFGKKDSYPPVKHVLFVGWAGLRGADSLVIALALPFVTQNGQSFPARALIIFLTFAIILVTLVLQGLTIVPVIHLLGLRDDSGPATSEETMARLSAAKVGLRRLNELSEAKEVPREVVDELKERYSHLIHRLTQDEQQREESESDKQIADAYQRARLAMIDAERGEVVRLRDDEAISDDVMRRIQEDLDVEEVLLSPDEDGPG
jgi:CPA1 family monovalent cation:H+ antiporter